MDIGDLGNRDLEITKRTAGLVEKLTFARTRYWPRDTRLWEDAKVCLMISNS